VYRGFRILIRESALSSARIQNKGNMVDPMVQSIDFAPERKGWPLPISGSRGYSVLHRSQIYKENPLSHRVIRRPVKKVSEDDR
jgi:hypothetical protein